MNLLIYLYVCFCRKKILMLRFTAARIFISRQCVSSHFSLSLGFPLLMTRIFFLQTHYSHVHLPLSLSLCHEHFDCCIFSFSYHVRSPRRHRRSAYMCRRLVCTVQWYRLRKYRLQSARITMCEVISQEIFNPKKWRNSRFLWYGTEHRQSHFRFISENYCYRLQKLILKISFIFFRRHSTLVFLVMLNEPDRFTFFFVSSTSCRCLYMYTESSSKHLLGMQLRTQQNMSRINLDIFVNLSIAFADYVSSHSTLVHTAQFPRSNVIIKLIIISECFHFLIDWATIDRTNTSMQVLANKRQTKAANQNGFWREREIYTNLPPPENETQMLREWCIVYALLSILPMPSFGSVSIINFDSEKDFSSGTPTVSHSAKRKFRVHFQEMNEWSTHLGRLQADSKKERKEKYLNSTTTSIRISNMALMNTHTHIDRDDDVTDELNYWIIWMHGPNAIKVLHRISV